MIQIPCPEVLEVVAQLRSRIQFHADIPYVFAGSIRQDKEK